jgi:signal transduction histidine kinase
MAVVETREHGSGALLYLVQAADGSRMAGGLPLVGGRRGWIRTSVATPDDGHVPENVLVLAQEWPGGLVVAVGDDLQGVESAEQAVLAAFAWALGVAVLLAIAGGAWLSHLFLRQVDTMSRTAEVIIGGDLTQRIPVRGTGDELDGLAKTLNRMLDRIAALMDSVRQASNNIAHDLRTPLSRLGQRMEDALARATTVADWRRALEGARNDVQALLGTFSALLRIAEVEAGAQRAAFELVELTAIAETIVEAFTAVAEDEGHILLADITPGVKVYGDRELLTQLLVNLVENAISHTPAGTRITLVLCEELGRAALVVEDTGPGVPKTERDKVLQRFYRLEQSRTTSGSGLGLSLVSAIAELHDADLTLVDARPGLRAVVAFPPSSRQCHAIMRE